MQLLADTLRQLVQSALIEILPDEVFDLFLDSGGEMLMVWVKLEKFLPEIRGKSVGPTFLSNIERVVETSAAARERLPIFRRRMAQIRERMLAAAKA